MFLCAAFDKVDLTMMQYNVKLYKERTFHQREKGARRCASDSVMGLETLRADCKKGE